MSLDINLSHSHSCTSSGQTDTYPSIAPRGSILHAWYKLAVSSAATQRANPTLRPSAFAAYLRCSHATAPWVNGQLSLQYMYAAGQGAGACAAGASPRRSRASSHDLLTWGHATVCGNTRVARSISCNKVQQSVCPACLAVPLRGNGLLYSTSGIFRLQRMAVASAFCRMVHGSLCHQPHSHQHHLPGNTLSRDWRYTYR